ncbi:MAG TPA: histidinol-phosphatase HisJ family protein [Chthoniobacterales bacterium]
MPAKATRQVVSKGLVIRHSSFDIQRMLADYHTHTPLCHHATGLPVEYARVAREGSLAEIGISDHNPMPAPFDDWRMDINDFGSYLDMVESARSELAPFPVRLGLECDFFPGQENWIEDLASRASWDYLIGSVHYIAPGWDVDNPKWIGRFSEWPVAEIWKLYFDAYEKCIASGLFDFVAHPDLVKKFGHRPKGDLRKFYEASIAAAADNGTVIEVSTAGLRKPAGEIYPAREFLEMAHEAGVGIVISSDAHSPEEVGMDFDQALTLVKDIGFTQSFRFQSRTKTSIPLP